MLCSANPQFIGRVNIIQVKMQFFSKERHVLYRDYNTYV